MQQYPHAHGTRNASKHLTTAHGLHKDITSQNKLLTESQKTIESMMKSATQIAH